MTQQHFITPPPELVVQWIKECSQPNDPRWQEYEQDIATRASQWGADQELEACCEWLMLNGYGTAISRLRAARRPKPPSLKEQALLAIDTAVADYRIAADVADVVRRALEQLPDNN
jgi:DNA-directed RNA polymerase specialized sigma24 family protein